MGKLLNIEIGGTYASGKTAAIFGEHNKGVVGLKELLNQELYKKGFGWILENKKIESAHFGEVHHSDRYGMFLTKFEKDLQVIFSKEWVTTNKGKLMHGEVVGPLTPTLSQLAFLYQHVCRQLEITKRAEEFPGLTICIKDVSFFDSYKFYIPTFLELGVLDKPFLREEVEPIKKAIGIDLTSEIGKKRLDVLDRFYKNPGLIIKDSKILPNFSDPDLYVILVVKPSVVVQRAIGRNRENINKLSEADIEYASILWKHAVNYFQEEGTKTRNPVALIDTSSLDIPTVSKNLLKIIESVLDKHT